MNALEVFLKSFTLIYAMGMVLLMDIAFIESRFSRETYHTVYMFCGACCTCAILTLRLTRGTTFLGKDVQFIIMLPCALVLFIMAKHRDGRFFFAFCTADMIGMAIGMLGTIIGALCGNTVISIAVSKIVTVTLLVGYVLKFVQKPFRQVLNMMSKGWNSASFIALLFYIMLSAYFITPTPINTRPQDMPIGILMIVLLFSMYGFIFKTIARMQEIHNTEQTEQVLKLQIAMQRQLLKNFSIHEITSHYCENTTINALLGGYFEDASKQGIFVSCRVAVPKKISVDVMELCVILSILLENAMEAACAITDGEKTLSLFILKNQKQLCIKMENTYNGSLKQNENADFISTKPRGNGMGLKSVHTIVEKYKGVMDIAYTENIFTVFAALKI